MTVIIRRRQGQGTELEEIGRVTNGSVQGDIDDLFPTGSPTEAEALQRFTGPVLFAARATTAEAAGDGPLSHIPGVPDSPDRLTRPMLQQIVKWKAEQIAKKRDGITVSVGKQYEQGEDGEAKAVEAGEEFSRHFNPSLHPRDPDTGQFVERPYDIELDQRTLDNTPTPDLLQFLKDEGEPVDQWIQSDTMTIDGIPNDATSLDDARQKIRERGTPAVDDPSQIPDDAVGDRMHKPERRNLEPGETVVLEQNGERVGMGTVVENDGAKLTVDEGDETNVYPISNTITRRVDPSAVPSQEEQEMGVRPDDFDTSGDADGSGFNQTVQVDDESRRIAQEIVGMVDDLGSAPSLSSDAAWTEREGARAGSKPRKTGNMEAEEFRQLKAVTAKALQGQFKGHDEVPRQAAKQVLSDLDRMKGKSYSDAGKTFENAVQERMDMPGDLRNDDKSIQATGDNPEYKKAAEVMTALSQEVFREAHGDERELHRGLQATGGAQLVNSLLQSDPDADGTFTFSENVIANYSAAENVAQDFARSAWVTRPAKPDDVAHASDDVLGNRSSFRGEGEIALGTGETTVQYDDVKIKSDAGEDPVTVGEIFGKQVDELGVAEMNNVDSLLRWLNKRDVEVPDQSDVPDGMQDWLEAWVERQADTMVVSMDSDTRAVLRQVLGNDRFEEARKGSDES